MLVTYRDLRNRDACIGGLERFRSSFGNSTVLNGETWTRMKPGLKVDDVHWFAENTFDRESYLIFLKVLNQTVYPAKGRIPSPDRRPFIAVAILGTLVEKMS